MTLDEITEWAHQILDEMTLDEIADILWIEHGPDQDRTERIDAEQQWIAAIHESDDTGTATVAAAAALYRIVSDRIVSDTLSAGDVMIDVIDPQHGEPAAMSVREYEAAGGDLAALAADAGSHGDTELVATINQHRRTARTN